LSDISQILLQLVAYRSNKYEVFDRWLKTTADGRRSNLTTIIVIAVTIVL
jgi:hypothetical protein